VCACVYVCVCVCAEGPTLPHEDIYTVYKRYFWSGFTECTVRVRFTHTVLANPRHVPPPRISLWQVGKVQMLEKESCNSSKGTLEVMITKGNH
jgi:hypothetical protein